MRLLAACGGASLRTLDHVHHRKYRCLTQIRSRIDGVRLQARLGQ